MVRLKSSRRMDSLCVNQFYMFSMAILAAFPTMARIRLVKNKPSYIFPEFDIIMLCQTISALVQLVLLVLLCPRTVSDDEYFAVAFDGVAHRFYPLLRAISFAVLVCLATNNVVMTAISLYHRRLVIMGRKITELKVSMLVAIYPVFYCLVVISLMFTGNLTGKTHNPEEPALRFNFSTPIRQIVLGVTAAIPVIVFLYAIFVSWEAKRLLSSHNDTAIEAMNKMQTSLWKAFYVQATIPLITALAILVWYLKQLKIIQGVPLFEYLLFGVVPVLLRLQAMMTPKSIGRDGYVTVDSFACSKFFFEFVISYALTSGGFAVYFLAVFLYQNIM